MKRIHIILSLCLLGILACARIDAAYDKEPANTSSLIPAEMYYHTAGSCENGDLVFVSLSATGLQLWEDPAQVVTGQIQLFLHEDGSYAAHYEEYDPVDKIFEKQWSSTYTVDTDHKLVYLKDLGTGQIVERQSGPVLEVQFTESINNFLLKGMTTDFRVWDFLQGQDQDRTDYCQY